MKIRIYDDSIRLRLDRSEVEQLGQGQAVTCQTHFPDGGVFSYALAAAGNVVAAHFADGCITLEVPASTLSDWAADETAVSITQEQALAHGPLKLLIEKDFECLDPRPGENQDNRFKNPKAAS